MSLNFGRAWMPSSSIVVPSFNSSFSIYFDILQKHTSKLSNNKLDEEEAKKKKQQVFLTGIFRYSKTFPYLSDSNYRRCKLFGESTRGSKTCTHIKKKNREKFKKSNETMKLNISRTSAHHRKRQRVKHEFFSLKFCEYVPNDTIQGETYPSSATDERE